MIYLSNKSEVVNGENINRDRKTVNEFQWCSQLLPRVTELDLRYQFQSHSSLKFLDFSEKSSMKIIPILVLCSFYVASTSLVHVLNPPREDTNGLYNQLMSLSGFKLHIKPSEYFISLLTMYSSSNDRIPFKSKHIKQIACGLLKLSHYSIKGVPSE